MTNKLFLVISLILILTGVSYGWVEEIDGNWGSFGLTKISESPGHVELNLSLDVIGAEDFIYDGNTYQNIVTRGVFLPANEGAPNLPSYSGTVIIPQGANIRVEVVDYRTRVYQNIIPVPAPEIPFENDDSPLMYEEDQEIYGSSKIYPDNIVQTSAPYQIRGVDVVTFGIIPFQWDPVSHQLTAYPAIKGR